MDELQNAEDQPNREGALERSPSHYVLLIEISSSKRTVLRRPWWCRAVQMRAAGESAQPGAAGRERRSLLGLPSMCCSC